MKKHNNTTLIISVFMLTVSISCYVSAEPLVYGQQMQIYSTPDSPQMMSFGLNGELFAGNADNSGLKRIYKIGAGGTPINTHGDLLRDPDAVIYDSVGHTWNGQYYGPGTVLVGGATDTATVGHIEAILPDGTTETLWESSTIQNPSDFKFDPLDNQRLLFTDHYIEGVFETSGSEPSLLFTTPARPFNLAVADDGRIFVGMENGNIGVWASDGTVIDTEWASGSAGDWIAMELGLGGIWGTDLYAISQNSDSLFRFDTSDGSNVIIGTGFTGNYADIAFGPDETMYISEPSSGHRILTIPEPATLSLLALGGLVLLRKRK